MIRYQLYIDKVEHELKNYKEYVDDCEKKYLAGLALIDRKMQEVENAGCYNADYINKYKAGIEDEKTALCSNKYAPLLNDKRKQTQTIIDKYINFIEKDLNAFFGGDIDPALANKVQALQSTGVKLSDKEFDVLKGQAKSYFDLRIINQLAETRTKETQAVTIENGKPTTETKETRAPYVGKIELPDPDKTFKSFNEYKAGVNAVLNYYCGNEYKLKKALGDNGRDKNGCNIEIVQCAFAENFFKQKKGENLTKELDIATAVLPQNEKIRELTEKEKAFIDTLIDEKHPFIIPQEVAKYCKLDEHLADLLLLDDRYKDFVEIE